MTKPIVPHRYRRWSITARLAAFYFVSVIFLLLALNVGIRLALQAQEEREDQALLSAHAELLRAMLLHAPDNTLQSLKQIRAIPDAGARAGPNFFVRVLDPAGNVVGATPDIDRVAPRGTLSIPPDEGFAYSAGRTVEGEFFRSISLWIKDAQLGRKWLLEVAIDESADVRFGDSLWRNITALSVLGLFVAAGLGAWVARSTLRPLTTLTAATSQVTPGQFRARFDTEGWPVELVRLADAFEKMLARLEGAFERLGEFSANLSHELRTPINNLRGETEVVLAQSSTAAEYRAVLESSLEEYDRLTRLIDNLLFIARAESAETKIDGEALDVTREVAAVLEYYDAVAEEAGVQLRQRGEARLHGDSVLFRRLLSNLLSNALRHTPRGGTIEIATERLADGGTEIQVHDSGTGIPAEHLARIFDRFYRVEDSVGGSDGSGFGLGLSIVKSIMSMHGGTVSIDSAVGQGTSVRIVFPATRAR